MLELYNFKQSTCSQKVRFCLAEKGLEWTDHILDSRKSEQLQPEYLKINPNGLVPSLIHDGNIIIDSSVILEYLDEGFPEIAMVPTDVVKRAWCRKWLRYFEEIPTPAIRYPSFQNFLIRSFEKLNPEEFETAAKNRPLRTDFYRRMGTDGFSEAEMKNAMDNLQQSIDRVDAAVADTGGPWIMGEMLTIADACYLPSIDRMDDLSLSHMWDDRPNMAGWYEAIKARPSYATTYYHGTRLTDLFNSAA